MAGTSRLRLSDADPVDESSSPIVEESDPETRVEEVVDEFYKTILDSKRLRAEQKQELEIVIRIQAQEEAETEEAQELAAQQARMVYVCEGCGLQFFGILEFAEHDEESRHMTNRGKKVVITGHL
jgi:rubrerythrin